MNNTKPGAKSKALPQPDLFGDQGGSVPARPSRKRVAAQTPVAAKPATPKPFKTETATGGLINTQQAALRLGLCKSTLDKMRCKGKGPRFIKSTDRAVRYDPADLDAWISDRRRNRTDRSDLT